ncbi:DUF2087 domain-containing protein [Chengkuizengella axinellae]|uniref:DUF2087 domain-containing protein n=1 Tax=Chengkuizengella axinellae TaxID=3064388 RepID=A0ABT9IVL3_9BACL|nr:DUF2087 domain-containing protein [Chengkuizengella sp. 2205SS18-9]MDP5273382.1 DUF2087 domain-containing protein [Chengkuizengella sp. 2205SS18-9]
MKNLDLFWNASLEEMKCGYMEEEEVYTCLLCGEKIEKGIIYPDDGILYEASKYIRVHIEKTHQSVFDYLIRLNKKVTGLTDHQNTLLRLFFEGKNDKEIQKETGIGSASTIRNHRFALKEKERQSKSFLVLMELLKEKDKKTSSIVIPHKTATMVDDRYVVTEKESIEILAKYFPEGTDGPLTTFSMKEKHKLIVLREIVKKLEGRRIYTEKELNQILKTVYDDYVILRRYLIEYGFLDRKGDGSAYWLKEGEEMLNNRKEAVQTYLDMKKEAGVYQIKNKMNQMIFIGSSMNLKSLNGRQFELDMGSHPIKKLQNDYNKYGKDAFTFEVLQLLDDKEDENIDKWEALKKLEEKWMNELQPYGEKGYNTKKA